MSAPETPEVPAKRKGRGGKPGNTGGGRPKAPPETCHVRYPGFHLPPDLAARAEAARLPGEARAAMVRRLFLVALEVGKERA